MELTEILSQLAQEIEDKYGYFKDPNDYESWRLNKIEEYATKVIEWNNKLSI